MITGCCSTLPCGTLHLEGSSRRCRRFFIALRHRVRDENVPRVRGGARCFGPGTPVWIWEVLRAEPLLPQRFFGPHTPHISQISEPPASWHPPFVPKSFLGIIPVLAQSASRLHSQEKLGSLQRSSTNVTFLSPYLPPNSTEGSVNICTAP